MKKIMFFFPLIYIGGTEVAILSLIKKLKGFDIYIGYVNENSDKGMLEEFSKYAIDKLSIAHGLLINSGSTTIKKVAIVGGGGSRGWRIAKEENADIFISGDAPHHIRRDIVNNKYNYLDLPHEIEKIFMPTLCEIIKGFDETLDITLIDHEKEPKVVSKD